MASVFTCIACHLAFGDADVQRAHYKTDWHRYNLKRKMTELPPVTVENFNERVLHQRAQVDAVDKPATSLYCESCHKRFTSDGAYHSHCQSAKHRAAVASATGQDTAPQLTVTAKSCTSSASRHSHKGAPASVEPDLVEISDLKQTSKVIDEKSMIETEERMEEGDEETAEDKDEDWEDDSLGMEECMFCSHVSSTLDENLAHMSVVHGFFVPDAEYLVDVEGLISHLGEKVGVGKMCLWCNEKGRGFYTTKAVQQHMIDKGHCKMLFEGDAVYEFSDFYDYRTSYPKGAGEDSGQEEGDEETQLIPISQELLEDDYSLTLPSGATIGHRSLLRYYRQNLVSRFHPDGRRLIMGKVLSGYRALGWTGAIGEAAEKRVRDLAFVQRVRAKHSVNLGVKGNKLQRHYRRQDMRF